MPRFTTPNPNVLDVLQKRLPFGVWIDSQTGETRYYNEKFEFYSNKPDIDQLQAELNDKIVELREQSTQ